MKNPLYTLAFTALLSLVGSPVLADEGDVNRLTKAKSERQFIEEEAHQALRQGLDKQAVILYRKILSNLNPLTFESRDLCREYRLDLWFKIATIHFDHNRDGAAKKALTRVFLIEPNHGQGHYFQALLLSRKYKNLPGSPGDKKEFYKKISHHLFLSIEGGYNPLRGVLHNKVLQFMKRDAPLIIRLLVALKKANTLTPSDRMYRNPFHPRIQLKPEGVKAPDKKYTPGDFLSYDQQKRERELVRELETTLHQIQSLLAQNNSSISHGKAIYQLWQKLRRLSNQQNEIIHLDRRRKVNQLLNEVREIRPQIQKALLQYYFFQGKKTIRNMEQNLSWHRYTRVIEGWEQLRNLVQTMVKAGGEEFKPSAQLLLSNGRPYYHKAKVHREIAQIRREVTGIVLSLQPQNLRKALINKEWYREGDLVRDQRGKTTDLQVKSIVKNRVVFEYKGVEISAYLRD